MRVEFENVFAVDLNVLGDCLPEIWMYDQA